jgi:hypothetical protein
MVGERVERRITSWRIKWEGEADDVVLAKAGFWRVGMNRQGCRRDDAGL